MTNIKTVFKQLYRLCLCMLILSALIACETPKKIESTIVEEGHTLNWNIQYMPRIFYPTMTLSDEEKQIVNNLYEGLTRVEDDELSNAMAQSILQSDDGLSYLVTLRESKWSDGIDVTVDDFLYSWERTSNYAGDVNLLYYDAFIKEVEVIDDRSMTIHLYQRNDMLLHQLSMVDFMPVRRDIVDLDNAIPMFISNVTNGPYYLIFDELSLMKNDHYYDIRKVKIEKIQIHLNNDFDDAYQHYEKGTLDFLYGVDYERLSNLMQNEDEFKLYNRAGIYSLAVNSNHPALKDVRIRRALNIAIDRTEVNPFDGIVDDTVMFSMVDYEDVETLNVIEEDAIEAYYMVMKPYAEMDKINGIVAALGTGQLETIDGLRIVTLDNPNDIKIANLLVAGWEEYLGVKLTVVPKSRYDYAHALKKDDYEIILDNHYYLEGNIRHTLKYFIGDVELNSSEFSSVTFDDKLLSTYQEADIDLYHIFKSVTDELDVSSKMIPLFKIYDGIIMSSNIEDWSRSYENLFYFGRASKTVQDKEAEVLE